MQCLIKKDVKIFNGKMKTIEHVAYITKKRISNVKLETETNYSF